MSHELTIIVTVYNIGEYLPRFFESMQAQSYTDYLLLMVDDGSTDNSLEVCKRYAEKDDRIEIVELEHIGISAARNISMGHIATPFTAYADGDDYVEKDYLLHLMNAQKKYNADLAISRVRYCTEECVTTGEFPQRDEVFIDKNDFAEYMPMLIDDRRLNYLYGKVYRSELLKDLRVEDDVRQGSDTMFNSQYVGIANSIVLIDDLDYNYIKYNTRSVTSYNGTDAYQRICRINAFLADTMKKNGYLTDKMQSIIDKRILLSATWCVDRILSSDCSASEKKKQIKDMLSCELYLQTWNGKSFNKEQLGFEPINPFETDRLVDKTEREKQKNKIKGKILAVAPPFVVKAYHFVSGKNNE